MIVGREAAGNGSNWLQDEDRANKSDIRSRLAVVFFVYVPETSRGRVEIQAYRRRLSIRAASPQFTNLEQS